MSEFWRELEGARGKVLEAQEAARLANRMERLLGNADFVEWAVELLIDLGIFHVEHGNPQNAGVRVAARYVLNQVASNGDVRKEWRQRFLMALTEKYAGLSQPTATEGETE